MAPDRGSSKSSATAPCSISTLSRDPRWPADQQLGEIAGEHAVEPLSSASSAATRTVSRLVALSIMVTVFGNTDCARSKNKKPDLAPDQPAETGEGAAPAIADIHGNTTGIAPASSAVIGASSATAFITPAKAAPEYFTNGTTSSYRKARILVSTSKATANQRINHPE